MCKWDQAATLLFLSAENLPPATAFTVLEFPSAEAAKAWYNDPDYAPFIKLRQTGAELDLVVVEGSNG